ncbi:MAG: exosortase A [Pseudomonadota bacterium]
MVRAPEAGHSPAQGTERPRLEPFVVAGLVVLLVIAAFAETVGHMAHLWLTHPTYHHGLLVLPIALVLLWDDRARLGAVPICPDLRGLGAVAVCGAVWYAGQAALIGEVAQFALIGILLATVWTVLGGSFFKAAAFPLFYLVLMVPTGTFLLAPLQALATGVNGTALHWAGIPVYVQGFLIEAPYGTYHVAPGCAGLNFVLATLVLAPVYARLVYRSVQRRVMAIGLMLAGAVAANSLRIFLIIILAEATGREIDLVDDHLVYGWGFFLVILFAAGWFGLRFSDLDEGAETSRAASSTSVSGQHQPIATSGLALLVVTCLAFPVLAAAQTRQPPDNAGSALQGLPAGWRVVGTEALLNVPSSDFQLAVEVETPGGARAHIVKALFSPQRMGHEASPGAITSGDEWAMLTYVGTARVDVTSRQIPVHRYRAELDEGRYAVWQASVIGGEPVAGGLDRALKTSRQGGFGGDGRALLLAILMPSDPDNPEALERMAIEFFAEDPSLNRLWPPSFPAPQPASILAPTLAPEGG